jgi:hypothetical protein
MVAPFPDEHLGWIVQGLTMIVPVPMVAPFPDEHLGWIVQGLTMIVPVPMVAPFPDEVLGSRFQGDHLIGRRKNIHFINRDDL